MNIGIIGSGIVGQQLGYGLAKAGHKIKVGTRDTIKLQEWKNNTGDNASVGSFEDAAEFGEIIILCTLWTGTENAIKMAGLQNFKNKIVIDVTNPLDFSKGVPPVYAAAGGASGGEIIQQILNESMVVKAFNMVNARTMINPSMEEGKPDMFIAGNDDEAKKKVTGIARQLGWENFVDMGDISKSVWLETLAMMWIHYGFKYGTWIHAFKLLKK